MADMNGMVPTFSHTFEQRKGNDEKTAHVSGMMEMKAMVAETNTTASTPMQTERLTTNNGPITIKGPWNKSIHPPEASPNKVKNWKNWFGSFNVVYRVNEMQVEKSQRDKLPDTNLSPPTVKRMIPLPVIGITETDPILREGKRDDMASKEGVTNPAFDTLERLQVNGNTWSETSSDNNKVNTINSRKSYDVTDSLPWNSKKPDRSDKSYVPDDAKTATMKSWDVFRVANRSKDNGIDDESYNTFLKGVKIAVSIFLTLAILLLTMLSKSTLFLITSNIYSNVTLECTFMSETGVTACRRVPADRVKTDSFHPAPSVQARWLWALFLVVCSPHMFTFGKCFWRMCFKTTRNPTPRVMFLVLAIETLHTAGMSLFAFYVLPSVDPLRGLALTFGVGVIPAFLKMFDTQRENGRKFYIILADIIALVSQISILIIWPIRNLIENASTDLTWTIPCSLLLISVGWWENYINRFTKMGTLGIRLKEFKHKVRRMRTKIYIFVSLWKIILTLVMMTVMMTAGNKSCLSVLYFDIEFAQDCPHLVNPIGNNMDSDSLHTGPFWVALVQILSCLMCYQFSKIACKVMLQVVSFSLPLMMVAPIMSGIFIASCEAWNTDGITNPLLPPYLYWTCDINGISRGFLETLYSDYILPVSLLWWLSFMWVTFHIWMPRVERLVQTERLFVQPLYCGVMLEQSMMLNRRRDDHDRGGRNNSDKKRNAAQFAKLNGPYPSKLPMTPRDPIRQDPAPMIYVCATMWHETEKEVLQVLTSIFRLDDDQCARKNAQRFFDVVDPDYYEFEAHIFFDDAYEPHDNETYEYYVNSFVKQLVRTIDKAASKVHRVPMRLAPPTRYPTPYGGRLEWSLLGGNKLVAHLKDKSKIRIKKRWSQVMYMYYLLGHRLVGQNLDARRKQTLADNTYLLTLDGDVDFKPSAVQVLVDRMKRNEKVGAACGRIHPIGMGPMIWYQKFEYAISHWLQKATEHMIGCVLCSPGCFSLFRASALMDDNVMGKYATTSSQAKHYVQYDQGEDRWLCTLLLQQGYRVEYCAAADALTYAPEGFEEFYNQRRRWSPSTMANIMDLLGDWKNVVKRNENISLLYIVYQLLLFCSSLLTPATIFLLITGALNTAFPALDLMMSLTVNAIPVGLFLLACFFCDSKWQLRLAEILSACYALCMMVVIVGLGLNMVLEGVLCSPTAMFLFFLLGVFIVSAILHPQEFYCLLHGALYFLAVPSMSMLLMIYSICNMHIVSWGTRESAIAVNPNEKPQQKPNSKLQTMLQKFSRDEELDSDYGFSFGNLFRCLCCPKPTPDRSENKFELVLEKLATIERAVAADNQEAPVCAERDASADEGVSVTFETVTEDSTDGVRRRKESSMSVKDTDETKEYEEVINPVYKPILVPYEDENTPKWLDDEDLGKGRTRYIGNEEKAFWKDLIKKYLLPLEKNEAQQKKMQHDLVELRNKMCIMFFMLNGLFIVIIFTLQYTNAVKEGHGLSIPLPCYATNGRRLTLEPISLLFMVVYGIALFIQFVSMFFHRLGTALHIISSTEINCMKPNNNEINSMDIASKIALVKEMQQMNDDDDDKTSVTTTNSSDIDEDSSITQDDSPKIKRRKTLIRISKRKRHQHQGEAQNAGNLGSKFMKNFMDLAEDLRKERVSENSNTSHGRLGRRKGSSGNKRKSRRTMRAMTSLQQDKDSVLKKADAIETKMQKISRGNRHGGENSANKVDSWLHLARDVLGQSRTSLNTIGEEDKRNSHPGKNRLSRTNSLETISQDEVKTSSLPKRATYAGLSPLNIIADEDETVEITIKEKKLNTNEIDIPADVYEHIVVERRPKPNQSRNNLNRRSEPLLQIPKHPEITRPHSSVTPRFSEEDARANSIESESDTSDQSDTLSIARAAAVTFNNNPEYITNFAEAGSISVAAPDDVFEESVDSKTE